MKDFKKFGIILLIEAICVGLSYLIAYIFFNTNEVLKDITDPTMIKLQYLKWIVFFTIMFTLFAVVLFSHKFVTGKGQEVAFFLASSILISAIFSYILYALIACSFDLELLVWFDDLQNIVEFKDPMFWKVFSISVISFVVLYVTFIDRRIILLARSGIRGSGKLKQINSNLENSRWMNEFEKKKLFKSYKYTELKSVRKDGIPVTAVLDESGKNMKVAFNNPCHAIVIGSTGSGKTTTFVSPMIQILGATAAGSSMIITDPKGELFSLHSKYLAKNGYDVKVIDLRDTYASYRWNPLDGIWETYQKYLFSHNDAYLRKKRVDPDKLRLADPIESFEEISKWYEFNGAAYSSYDHLVEAIKIYKKKMFDEVYEDLNDLVSILIPVENPKDPMWEKGARSIVLATLLAMLEDSADPRLGMTKEKFNFFNMTKILQNSNNDYLELKNYFAGRSVLSKALSLSKQVCDCAESTRASYMSIVYEKLTLFNDTGICALTSASDFSSEQLAYKPTALFLKIPDEKDTRHNLASIFILNIYKTLIKVASATEELTLDRNVYFIMDEFGNMPKIEKFDKFITVGRSRKIWFIMIIQSYAQLNNVYGDTVADIVKGNCGIKMFIGSNDMNTCKEYSELCGNITVVTNSTNGSVSSTDVSLSSQTQVRPLIYPSDLQRLNHPGDIGHSIIVTFGNYPLKTEFTPSYKVPFYVKGKMDTSQTERLFDENTILYSANKRNEIISGNSDSDNSGGHEVDKEEEVKAETQKVKEKKAKNAIKVEEAKAKEDQDLQNELIEKWQILRAKNPNMTLNEFFKEMSRLERGK